MKKLLSVIIVAFATTTLFAQSQALGVQLEFSEFLLRQNSALNTKKLDQTYALNGGKIGLIYDATLIKGFGFTLGLNYGLSGISTSWPSATQHGDTRNRTIMHTLELPIDWQYKFEIAKKTWLIVYTGPTIQYNFRFQETTYTKVWDDTQHKWIINSYSADHYSADSDADGVRDYSPLNITWGLGAGFQYKNYYLRGGYDFGIYSHYRDAQNNISDYRNRARLDQWNIRLGFYFLNF